MLRYDHPSRSISRRRLLQVGGVGALGLALPRLLQSRAAAAESQRRGSEKSCIFILQYGGASQIDTWDIKPEAPAEIRSPYQSIATATPGLRVCELMPRLAALSNDYCLLRSLTHSDPVHTSANSILLAGQKSPAPDSPAFGSVVAKLRPATRNVPSYVWLQKFGGGAAPPETAYLTGGFLGMAHSPLVIGKEHTDDPSSPNFQGTPFDIPAEISLERLGQRQQLPDQLDRAGGTQPGAAAVSVFRGFQQRAFDLIGGPDARSAFDINQEPDPVRDRYGRHPLGQHLLMARRLIEAGVRLVTVVAWTGLAPGDKFLSVETWDMHGNGTPIFGTGWNSLGWAVPRFDEAVSALLADLKDRGMLETTLVAAVGEFGRTPKIDAGGRGRDHWPHCYSAMLAGAGVRGGAIYGASDKHAAYVKDRPVPPEDFRATLLHALGISPETRISPDQFSRPASTGRPIMEIF